MERGSGGEVRVGPDAGLAGQQHYFPAGPGSDAKVPLKKQKMKLCDGLGGEDKASREHKERSEFFGAVSRGNCRLRNGGMQTKEGVPAILAVHRDLELYDDDMGFHAAAEA